MKITENFTYEELNPHKFEMSPGHQVNLERLAFYTPQTYLKHQRYRYLNRLGCTIAIKLTSQSS